MGSDHRTGVYSVTSDRPAAQARSRPIYVLLLLGVILLGLASRRYAYVLPHFLKKNAGDALWALAVFLLLTIVFPRLPTFRAGVSAFLIAALDEFSQLYHTPWLDAIRNTFVGHLFLGSGFAWGDMACYAVGCVIGVLLDVGLIKRSFTVSSPRHRSPCS